MNIVLQGIVVKEAEAGATTPVVEADIVQLRPSLGVTNLGSSVDVQVGGRTIRLDAREFLAAAEAIREMSKAPYVTNWMGFNGGTWVPEQKF